MTSTSRTAMLSVAMALAAAGLSTAQDCSGLGVTWGPNIARPPPGCDRDGLGGGGGGGQTRATCITPPCVAPHLGAIAVTTVEGGGHSVGTPIYGKYIAGFNPKSLLMHMSILIVDRAITELEVGTGREKGKLGGGGGGGLDHLRIALDSGTHMPASYAPPMPPLIGRPVRGRLLGDAG